MAKNNISISASITSTKYFDIKNTIDVINKSLVDRIHFDVMDGVFVPNITYGPDFISSIRNFSKKFFDVHLMLYNPYPYIENFVNAGADLISVHVEAKNTFKSIKLIKSLGKKAGVVINPDTNVKKVLPYLDFVDEVLVMSVNPGFGGQKFIPKVIDKIQKLIDSIKKYNHKILIQVDGGINFDNAKILIDMGVDSLVVGSFLFNQTNFNQAVLTFKNL